VSPSGLMSRLSSLYLPQGYPSSVTPDYLPYQLATVPAHITGWLSHSLVTSSLLKAVGVDAGRPGNGRGEEGGKGGGGEEGGKCG
jgi:hypothetical protein